VIDTGDLKEIEKENIHSVVCVPQESVVVVVFSGIKPQPKPLLYSYLGVSVGVNVCLDGIRLAWYCPQKLEVELVVLFREILVI
jgi:hypothetical protein